MLHRSFKSAKCKTALKLAVSRIKLLKNKREAQVRQLKRELAQLLESGQDQTARIRVEHVVREEKTMAAYDLIEIYCELIAARLPIIESQKNCPIDLKEAISSIIFASPRCADIPELMDVRKHITAKYGKEFASAAVELRPDCGVNRLLVEKLSVKAPDGPTKIKILAAIAEEHKVKWEPESFGENDVKPAQDLQIGPNTYERASYVEPPQVPISHVRDEGGPPNLHNYQKSGYVEHTQVHIPIVHDEEGPPNRHASSQHRELHNAPASSYDHNPSFGAVKFGGNKSTTPGRSTQEIRSSGSGSQEMDSRDSYSEDRSAFAVGRQNWNMEFKDAASAAQAAAESAERASMAARAAAELSNHEKITRQYSSGSQNSSAGGLRDEVPQEYAFHDDKHFSTESFYSTSHNSNPGMHNKHINTWEQDNLVEASDHKNVMKPTHLESVTASSASGLDNPFGSRSQMADAYSRNNSFEQEDTDFLHEISMKKQASTSVVDFVSELHDDRNTENNYFGDTQRHRNYTEPSSSQFITPAGDDNDVLELSDQKIGDNALPDLFVADEGNMQRKFKEKGSHDDSAVVFDDSGSEDDDFKFDIDKKYEETGSTLYFSSPARKTQIDLLANRNALSPGQVFDEKEGGSSSQSHISAIPGSLTRSGVSSGEEDLLPMTFDDSDGPSSESEEDLLQSNVIGSHDYGNSVANETENHGSLRSLSMNNGNVDSDRNMQLSASAVSSETREGHLERMNITTVSEKKCGFDDLATNQPSSGGINSVLRLDINTNNHQTLSPDTFDNTKTLRESRIESDKELNYGMLKGGLRNKAYKRPPYVKSQSGEVSSSSGDMSVQNERSSPRAMNSVNSAARAQDTYLREASFGYRNPVLRADKTSSGLDIIPNSQDTFPSIQDSHTQKLGEVNKESSSRVSVTYSDGSDSEDDLSKLNSVRLASPVNAFSRRTVAPSKTRTAPGWKSSSRVSYGSENERKASETESSDKLASSEVYSETRTAAKPFPQSNSSSHGEIAKSSSRMQVSSSHPKDVIPDSGEASKSSNPGGETPSKEKASHVHPKLPDYDSFAAHFLSLRKGRQ